MPVGVLVVRVVSDQFEPAALLTDFSEGNQNVCILNVSCHVKEEDVFPGTVGFGARLDFQKVQSVVGEMILSDCLVISLCRERMTNCV